MKQLKLISTSTVLLLIFLTTFLISGASAAGPNLKLPTFPVTATYDLTNIWPAHLTLSGVGTGYDVQDNVSYIDWCVERATQFPSQSGIPYDSLKLYSSYDPNLPANLKMFGTRVIPWDQINWILNNKGSYSGDTIQNAIWSLVEGQDTGSGDINVPILVNAAETNGTGFVPGSGQIIGVIVAQPPDGISTSSDNWQENIIEVTVPEPMPGINIVKYTNGQLANDPNGSDVPEIKPGDPVTWTYVVTNTGNVSIPIADLSVTDDQTGVTPVFDHEETGNANTIFDPGEVWVYVAHGVAVDLSMPPVGVTTVPGVCTHGQTEPPRTAYVNQGTATIPGATSKAKSSYCNPPVPGISIVKYTNGQLANDPNGSDVPEIKPGGTVTWTYVVTNTGNVPIAMADVNVTDDQTGVTPVFDHVKSGNADTIFDPGEVWVYVAHGVAVDLNKPPTGVIVVQGVCTHKQTQLARTAYVNQGTATIPGATSSAKSSYCNPLYKIFMPLPGSVILPEGFDVTVGFEDLPLGGGANDFDYNDWVTDIAGSANYELSGSNILDSMIFNISPRARGAAYDHTFHLAIPHGTFGSDGTAVLTIYDKNHQVISRQSTAFVASVDNDFVIFPKTSEVLPNLSDTYELQPYIPPNRYASLAITFNNPVYFDISKYNFSSPHGGGLFFDPYLHVINTGDTIHRGDIRMLTVPIGTYKWPEEQVRIDYAYPLVTFVPGNPPTITFPNNWWLTFNHCVYGDGIVCTLPKAPDGVIASPIAPVVTPSIPTVSPP